MPGRSCSRWHRAAPRRCSRLERNGRASGLGCSSAQGSSTGVSRLGKSAKRGVTEMCGVSLSLPNNKCSPSVHRHGTTAVQQRVLMCSVFLEHMINGAVRKFGIPRCSPARLLLARKGVQGSRAKNMRLNAAAIVAARSRGAGRLCCGQTTFLNNELTLPMPTLNESPVQPVSFFFVAQYASAATAVVMIAAVASGACFSCMFSKGPVAGPPPCTEDQAGETDLTLCTEYGAKLEKLVSRFLGVRCSRRGVRGKST